MAKTNKDLRLLMYSYLMVRTSTANCLKTAGAGGIESMCATMAHWSCLKQSRKRRNMGT